MKDHSHCQTVAGKEGTEVRNTPIQFLPKLPIGQPNQKPESEGAWVTRSTEVSLLRLSSIQWRLNVEGQLQSLIHVQLFVTNQTAACQAPLSFTISWSLLRFVSIESVMLSNHVIICYPLLLLPSIFPSTRIFSNESAICTRWPKYWSFSFSISPFNEYSGLISFSIDWFDLLEVLGTLTSLLQHHSSKTSILWHSAFFRIQLSHPYMTTGKTMAVVTICSDFGTQENNRFYLFYFHSFHCFPTCLP